MKQKSAFKPNNYEYFFNPKKNVYLVYLRENIVQEGDLYIYDEYKLEIPQGVNIEEYLSSKFETLLDKQREREQNMKEIEKKKQLLNQLLNDGDLVDVLKALIDNDIQLAIEIEKLKSTLGVD